MLEALSEYFKHTAICLSHLSLLIYSYLSPSNLNLFALVSPFINYCTTILLFSFLCSR